MDFAANFLSGFGLSFFLNKVVFLLVILSLFSLYSMKDWQNALNLFIVFFVSYSAILGLTILEIIYIEKSIIMISMYVFVLIIAVFNILSGSTNGNSRRSKKHKYRNTLAGIGGVLSSFYIQNVLIGRLSIANFDKLSDNLLLNVGVLVGLFVLVIILLVLGSVFIITFGVKKKEWLLLCTGASIGVVLYLMS